MLSMLPTSNHFTMGTRWLNMRMTLNYLLIPAANSDKTQEELDHIERWACLNNLQLNRKKTVEIVFTRRAAGGKPIVTPPTLISITRVNSLVILGVLINDCLTAKDHVTKIIEACSKTLYALRVLRTHGLTGQSIETLYRATVQTRLLYASPA